MSKRIKRTAITDSYIDKLNEVIDVVNDIVAGKIEVKPIDMCPVCEDMMMKYKTSISSRKFYVCPRCQVIYNG